MEVYFDDVWSPKGVSEFYRGVAIFSASSRLEQTLLSEFFAIHLPVLSVLFRSTVQGKSTDVLTCSVVSDAVKKVGYINKTVSPAGTDLSYAIGFQLVYITTPTEEYPKFLFLTNPIFSY